MLFHSPNTHSTDAPILLEALDADCDLHVLSMKAGEQRGAAYLAVNPVGKVPAVKHGEALVTEQVAVFLYLADLYPEAGLAPGTAPYAAYDTMLKTLTDQLAAGPYLLGEKFSAADVLWGTALTWTTMFKLVPELPVIVAYMARANARPAVARARARDAELAAGQA